MCMYANLAGMAIYFPLLFRMKFRFTNKTLLTSAALGVLLCNLIAPHITFLPLLWLVCFIEGMCKIQGTFECMSNIQLWMTPKRDFTVFFPWLHIVILGSIQLSDLITTRLMYHYHWTYMNLFVAGLMLIVLLIQFTCVKHFRFMRKFPLFGIDWLGGILWAALLAEIAFLFNYGDWYDWWNSPVIRQLTIVIFITLGICIWRMMTVRHPFLEPKMWTYRHFLPLLGLVTLVEAFLATEHVLEEVFYEEVMKYEELVSSQLDWLAIVGIVCGCVFSYWWMHVKQYNYVRLVIVGFIGLIGYLIGFYLTLSTDIHISQLYLPTVCRGFAYAVLSATFMVCLEEIMTFQHFFQGLSVFNMLHMVVGGVVVAAYALVFISDYLFLTDFRLWCFITIRAFAPMHFATIAKYLVFWLVYYIALSVATNGFNFVQLGKSKWLSTLVQMFFVFIGPEIMIGVQYITFFNKGFLWSELTHLGGSITGIWLYPIVFILPLAVFVCSKIYRKSKNPYIGGIIMGILACVISVTNTLTLG